MNENLQGKLRTLAKLRIAQQVLSEGMKELDDSIKELRKQTQQELEKND